MWTVSFGSVVSLGTPFGRHVPAVVRRGAKTKVLDVAARRVVTHEVPNPKTVRDRTVNEFPGEAMGQDNLPVCADLTMTTRHAAPCPFQAPVRLAL